MSECALHGMGGAPDPPSGSTADSHCHRMSCRPGSAVRKLFFVVNFQVIIRALDKYTDGTYVAGDEDFNGAHFRVEAHLRSKFV